MRKALVNREAAQELRDQGLSVQEVADHFKVAKSTIKRLLRPPALDKTVLDFTKRLEGLLSDVPDEYCAREVRRAINLMRTSGAWSEQAKHQKVIDSIRSGARELEEISEDCFYSKVETEKLLGELVSERRVEKRAVGASQNSRQMKYHYFLSDPTEK